MIQIIFQIIVVWMMLGVVAVAIWGAVVSAASGEPLDPRWGLLIPLFFLIGVIVDCVLG